MKCARNCTREVWGGSRMFCFPCWAWIPSKACGADLPDPALLPVVEDKPKGRKR